MAENLVDFGLYGTDAPLGGGERAPANRCDRFELLSLDLAEGPGDARVDREMFEQRIDATQERALLGRGPGCFDLLVVRSRLQAEPSLETSDLETSACNPHRDRRKPPSDGIRIAELAQAAHGIEKHVLH